MAETYGDVHFSSTFLSVSRFGDISCTSPFGPMNYTYNYSDIDKAVNGNDVLIVSFWNDEWDLTQGLHTVAVKINDDGSVIAYNNGNDTYFDSFDNFKDDFLNEDIFISLYAFKSSEEVQK